MAKAQRYPKKLRATLERIQKAKAEKPSDESKLPYTTCGQRLAGAWKVAVMHGIVDDEQRKIEMQYHFLTPEQRQGPVFNQLAPWLQAQPADPT